MRLQSSSKAERCFEALFVVTIWGLCSVIRVNLGPVRYLTLVPADCDQGKPNFAACLTSPPSHSPSFRSMYLIEGEHDNGA